LLSGNFKASCLRARENRQNAEEKTHKSCSCHLIPDSVCIKSIFQAGKYKVSSRQDLEPGILLTGLINAEKPNKFK
jgi:hypothetical protein